MLLILAACAAAPRHVESPSVDVVSVTGSVGARPGLVLELALVVRNQNERPFNLRALDWEVRAGGRARVRGRVRMAGQVAARGTARVDVDCEIRPGAAAELMPLLAEGIEIDGVVHLDAASGRLHWRGPIAIR
jgi:hypothetical protein